MKQKSTILIVDDEQTARDILEGLLGQDYDLAFANSGTEALAKASKLTPDLIILDVMMPGMTGFEVCRRLRTDPSIAEVPVIMVTILDDHDSRLQGIEAGADDFISKPFNLVELRARVRTITQLNRYRQLIQRAKELDAANEKLATLDKEKMDLLALKSRYEQDLSIAANIQKNLFPHEYPQDMGLQIAAVNVMARAVGGDYYDFIITSQGKWAMVVADAMGKGVSAALLMTTIRSVWQSFSALDTRSLSETLTMINETVYPDMKANEAFVTMFTALYNPTDSVFQYTNAGHNPPIFLPAAASGYSMLDVGGPPVGMFSDAKFPSSEFTLREGDIIVIYTDGVVEAMDKDDLPFGFEKLYNLINQNHNSNPESIKNAILSELDLYTGGFLYDDVTAVVLKKV